MDSYSRSFLLSFSIRGSSSLPLPLLPPTPPPPLDYFQLCHVYVCVCECVRACKRMCQALAGWLAGWFGKYLVTINDERVYLGCIPPSTAVRRELKHITMPVPKTYSISATNTPWARNVRLKDQISEWKETNERKLMHYNEIWDRMQSGLHIRYTHRNTGMLH